MEQRKRNISVRLSASDIRKVKDISHRLGVKESELFRFAIKNMLTKLMPLSDESLKGADLIPTWVECGNDLLTYFDIDVDRLDEIFNESAEGSFEKIDEVDLDLMILSNLNQHYAVKKLSELCRTQIDPSDVIEVFREYLYKKYVLGKSEGDKDASVAIKQKQNGFNTVASFN